jgi:2-dehydro-3-deoxy-D-gluconate 5-dehydrogenase
MCLMNVLDSFRLDGKTALVTGAGRGLGGSMAVALAQAGADIAGSYITTVDETRARVEALGRRFLPLPLDLKTATPADLQGAVERVVSGLGRLDILVNNAGIILRSPALEVSEAEWDDVLQVDLKAAFFLAQAAARRMVFQGAGKIINIASVLTFQGGLRVPAYAAAKSGLAAVTRALANELAAKNINVNAIAPGYVRTDNTQALYTDPRRYAAILERIPAGRWGDPPDLNGLVVLLASPAADYIHGAVIPVDGGWLAR